MIHSLGTTPFTLGDLHPIFLHFPIVWVTTAFLCDLIFLFKRRLVLSQIADWFIIGAAVLALPTVITGLLAAGSTTDATILTHRNWALVTFTFTLLHALYRGYSLYHGRANPNYIILSAINLCLVDITADYGGLIAFGTSLFAQ